MESLPDLTEASAPPVEIPVQRSRRGQYTARHAPAATERSAGHEGAALRLDIQGLRAVAVISVVAFHLWPWAIPGGFVGVDVFFVISGFLITTHLMQAKPTSVRDLLRFWGRRIRRLLPASLLVLLATLIATVVLVPDVRWAATARHVMASALYVENRQLASDSVDYLRATDPPTAVQHFWSLAVEEQFYLIWPILILLVGLLALRLRRRPRPMIVVTMAVAVAASLAYSVHLTATNPAAAYFSTPVRIWELGAGGLLAAALVTWERRPGPGWWWSLISIAGFGALILSLATFSGTTPFPGWRAALPVGGAVAVIAAGSFRERNATSQLLAVQPLPFIGGISYSIYLWHWPIIVLLPYVSGRLGPEDEAAIVIGTLILAVLTKRFVEDPCRRPTAPWIGRAPFRSAALGMAVVVLAGLGVTYTVDQRVKNEDALLAAAIGAGTGNPCFGAGAMALGPKQCPYQGLPPVPAPAQAAQDRSDLYADHCWATEPFASTPVCTYGDPAAKYSVALVGNSHAGEWLPALQKLMAKDDFNITTYVASGCNVTTTEMIWDTPEDAAACIAWSQRVIAQTTTGKYDLVFTAALQNHTPAAATDPQDAIALERAGHVDTLNQWVTAHVGVVVVRDPPWAPTPIPDCLATHPYEYQPAACDGKRTDWLHEDPLWEAAQSIQTQAVTAVDLTDRFCTATKCYAVAGGVTVYFDSNHMTKTYASTLAPNLDGPIQSALQRATAGP